MPIKVVVADDHEIFLDGMYAVLKKVPGVEIVGDAKNGSELVDVVRSLKPAVVVTDIKMPVMDGIEATRILTKELPGIGIIALSMFDEESLIVDMMEAGAKGYLLKNADKKEVINAIESVSKGQNYYCTTTNARLVQMLANSNLNFNKKPEKPTFNEKEIQIMQLLCREYTNKEIAAELFLSVRTVEGYRERIEEKINAKNSAGIVVYAIKNGIYKI